MGSFAFCLYGCIWLIDKGDANAFYSMKGCLKLKLAGDFKINLKQAVLVKAYLSLLSWILTCGGNGDVGSTDGGADLKKEIEIK